MRRRRRKPGCPGRAAIRHRHVEPDCRLCPHCAGSNDNKGLGETSGLDRWRIYDYFTSRVHAGASRWTVSEADRRERRAHPIAAVLLVAADTWTCTRRRWRRWRTGLRRPLPDDSPRLAAKASVRTVVASSLWQQAAWPPEAHTRPYGTRPRDPPPGESNDQEHHRRRRCRRRRPVQSMRRGATPVMSRAARPSLGAVVRLGLLNRLTIFPGGRRRIRNRGNAHDVTTCLYGPGR